MQDMSMENKLKQVGKAFNIAGDFISFEEIKVGNVNRTYRVNYVRDEDGKPMTLLTKLCLTPSDTAVRLDLDKAVEAAYAYGRGGGLRLNRPRSPCRASMRRHSPQ